MKSQVLSPKSKGGSRAGELRARGFTMIEIAICLAIIGFALVAIIGIMPTSMNTQKANRQETIINQDESVFMDAIRNGAQGLDDLTNYVVAITNSSTLYLAGRPPSTTLNWSIYNSSSTGLPLTNGFIIVGLLTTPKYIPLIQIKAGTLSYISNHVVAYVRSMSGPAAEKSSPSYTSGINPVKDLAFNLGFNYRMVSDVVPYFGYDTNGGQWTVGAPAGAPGYGPAYSAFSSSLQANLHDVRLTFLWPLLPSGLPGPGYQVFRGSATGTLTWTIFGDQPHSWPASSMTNVPPNLWAKALFFIQPRTYSQVTP